MNKKVVIRQFEEDFVELLYKSKPVGILKSELQLIDVLVQIKENRLKNYSVKVKSGRILPILDGGRIRDHRDEIFPIRHKLMEELMGF